jgi:tight adherence protein B
MPIPQLDSGLVQMLILAGLLAVLVLFLWAVWELASGAHQRRVIASRSALAAVEHRESTPLARFDTAVRRMELGRWLGRRLGRAGVELRVGTFVLLMGAACALAVTVVWQVLAPALGVLAILGVGALAVAYLRHQEDRRREDFTAQLPELARVLSNATAAGLALPTAIGMAADELDDPAATELRQMANSMRVGMPFEEALGELQQRMPSREIGVLAGTLFVASRSGGALVTALRNISDTLEARKETRREVRTILGESTATSWALVAIYVAALFGVNLLMPGVLDTMTSGALGIALLGTSLLLAALGVVLVRTVSRMKF